MATKKVLTIEEYADDFSASFTDNSQVSKKYVDDEIAAIPGGVTNLAVANKTATTFDVTSSTGNDATLPQATVTEAGLLSANDKIKINNIIAMAAAL